MSSAIPPPTAASRLSAPTVRREAIARERLARTLDAAAERPLTVVCAPAGFGKTTAVVQWLEGTGLPHAWLSVDASDNDPRWFAARLLAALDRTLPGRFEDARRAFHSGADVETTVIPLVANALSAQRAESVAIVLDDYHALSEPSCHRVTAAMIDAAPANAGVVVTSRTPPPLRLGRRRATGTVAEVGPEQLRFAPEESERLLNGPLGLGLGREQVALIDERLQGWAAGLALAASAIAGGRDRDGFLAALERSGESLDAYLTEEVLEAVRPELREFLRRTSILTELSGPLCEAVVGDPQAHDLLREVRQMNLFVTPLDREGGWFCYHDVFAATLSGELARREPELVGDLHRRAADWYERAGRSEEAMEHVLLAGDGLRAASLLEASWIGLITERRHVTVRRILRRLPDERGEHGPLCEALDLLCMIYEGVDQRTTAERAEALAARHGDDPRVRLVIDGILVSPFYGEVGRAVEIGREAWGRYAELPQMREQLVVQLALVLWFAGQYEEVRSLLEPRVRLDQPTFGKVWTLAILAITDCEEEDAEMAERHAREAMAEVVAVGGETATEFTGVPWVVGEALRLAGKLEEARKHMSRGLENEARRPGSVGHALALTYDADLSLAEGNRDRAARNARRAREIVDRYPDLGAVPRRLAEVEAALDASENALLGTLPTPAELRVLALLDSDRSLAQIGSELYLSRDTVKSHARRLYRRLGASSRQDAVGAARKRGLLSER